jgi:hypothetical protein
MTAQKIVTRVLSQTKLVTRKILPERWQGTIWIGFTSQKHETEVQHEVWYRVVETRLYSSQCSILAHESMLSSND